MITGELNSKIDAVWNDFWSGGISNPLEVMEQLTLLLFTPTDVDLAHGSTTRLLEAVLRVGPLDQGGPA